MAFDTIDAKILEILQENARASVSELSKRINLSISAVSERLKKLEASGIIKEYTAVLNPQMLNRQLQLSVRVKTDGGNADGAFLRFVSESGEILQCMQVAGSCDYMLRVATESTESLSALLAQLRAIKGVNDTECEVFLKVIKEKHSVPPIVE